MPFDPADPVLAPEALLADRDAFIVLDARPAEAFGAGRASGAYRLPIEAWEQAAKTEAGHLTNLDHWARAIGALGVDGSRPVAVLDDGRMTEAARLVHPAAFRRVGGGARRRVAGAGAVAARGGGEVETGPSTEGAALRFTPRPGSGRVTLVEREPLRAAFATGAAPQIFDTRTAAEHAGLDLRKNRRGGHLPGAASLPHADLLGPDNRMLPADVLRAKLAAAASGPAR